jgi:glycosyltransferase involved in cell wall biosynthesis
MDITKHPPFFSIILPLYNTQEFVSEAIQSVLKQSFKSWELIVIDDGSTDNSVTIVRRFCELDPRIKLLQQTNKKQPAARNLGIKYASGAWIAFIDADDLWLPEKLELQHDCIKKNNSLGVVFSDGYTKYQDKKIRLYYHYETAKGFFYGKDLYKKMIFGNCIPILSAVVKKSWVYKIGLQNEAVAGVEDHDYWLRLCKAEATFYGMEERLFEYRVHQHNFSSDLLNQYYQSLIIRMDNYDPLLLNRNENKKFVIFYKHYLKYFSRKGKAEWVKFLQIRFKKLKIPFVSFHEQLLDKILAFFESFKIEARRKFKQYLLEIVKIVYFYPKKKLSKYQDKLARLYMHWFNFKNFKNYQSIELARTARINFYNKSVSSLDTQHIYIGDFSIINFMEKNSKMVTGADVKIGKFCNFNVVGQLILGNNVLFNNHSTVTCQSEIIIGDNTWFGEGVRLYDHNHRYKDRNIPFTQQGYNNGKIEIGNNVWIGSNTVILKDVSIGDGCVIGANNVIYKSMPPNSILKSVSMKQIDVII